MRSLVNCLLLTSYSLETATHRLPQAPIYTGVAGRASLPRTMAAFEREPLATSQPWLFIAVYGLLLGLQPGYSQASSHDHWPGAKFRVAAR